MAECSQNYLVKKELREHPFGMITYGRSWQVGSDYRYGFGGQEQDDEVYGNGKLNSAEFWEFDTRLGRRWNIDPVRKQGMSNYIVFGNNPVFFMDPSGNDWYENNGYNKDDPKSGSQYQWFDGNGAQEGFTHLGENLVTFDKATNTVSITFGNNDINIAFDLNSETGKKFTVLAIEGGFTSQSAENQSRGDTHTHVKNTATRESFYGLVIIGATMENRLAATNESQDHASDVGGMGDGTLESMLLAGYNGAAGSPWISSFANNQLTDWYNDLDHGAVMNYLSDVYLVAAGDPVAMLHYAYNFEHPDRVFCYAHGNANPGLFQGYCMSYNLNKTLINIIKTNDVINRTTPWYLTPSSNLTTNQIEAFEQHRANTINWFNLKTSQY